MISSIHSSDISSLAIVSTAVMKCAPVKYQVKIGLNDGREKTAALAGSEIAKLSESLSSDKVDLGIWNASQFHVRGPSTSCEAILARVFG